MKLHTLFEARTSDDVKADAARNAGPEDLRVFLYGIEEAPDLEAAKEQARKMARFFAKGGQANFLKSVDKVTTIPKLLQLAWNASLKGEGLGVLKKKGATA